MTPPQPLPPPPPLQPAPQNAAAQDAPGSASAPTEAPAPAEAAASGTAASQSVADRSAAPAVVPPTAPAASQAAAPAVSPLTAPAASQAAAPAVAQPTAPAVSQAAASAAATHAAAPAAPLTGVQPAAVQHFTTFRMPPFVPEEPELWLLQVQCAFEVAGVTNDELRFKLIVANLPPNVAAAVKDVIRTSRSFVALSTALQNRLAQSRADRLKTLLSHQQLGDQKPSALLRAMRSEMAATGNAPVDTELFRTLFLQRLPQPVRAALALLPADSSLDRLAEAADRYLEASGPDPRIAAVAYVPPPPAAMPPAVPPPATEAAPSPGLDAVVASLVAKIERLEDSNRRLEEAVVRGRSQSRRRPLRRPPTPKRRSNSPSPARMCWYHDRFGSDARRCTPPCSWSAEN